MAALPDLSDWDERTRLSAEKTTLGFYVTGHPLESLRDLLADFGSHSSAALKDLESGSEVAVGGIVTDLRRRKSKNGAWWATLHLEELEGLVEFLVFPKVYDGCQQILANDRPLLIAGRVEVDEGGVRLRTDEVIPLEELRERKAQAVQVRLEAAELEDGLVERLRTPSSGIGGRPRCTSRSSPPGVSEWSPPPRRGSRSPPPGLSPRPWNPCWGPAARCGARWQGGPGRAGPL